MTLCNRRGHSTGDYVRNVFNNLAFAERLDGEAETAASAALRKEFGSFLNGSSVQIRMALQSMWQRYVDFNFYVHAFKI